MLYIKVKKNLMSKEIHIDKYRLIILKWQRYRVRKMDSAVSININPPPPSKGEGEGGSGQNGDRLFPIS
jgi:hypothetical protein